MIRKHSLAIHGHRTSISIEDAFWHVLERIAAARALPLAALITKIDETRPPGTNLSSAMRIFILEYVVANGNPAGRP